MTEKRIEKGISPAKQKQRQKANITDFVVIVLLALIVSGQESLNFFYKALIVFGYPFIVGPVLMLLGGTIGQRMLNLKLRKKSNPVQFINLKNAYSRLFLVILHYITRTRSEKEQTEFKYETLSDTVLFDKESELSDEALIEYIKQKARINFIIAAIIYVGWVIWVGNFWFLLGLPVLFDIYITKKINWTPWKKREGTNHWLVEWLDALIFAIVAVTIINIFLFQNYKIPTGSMEKSLLIGDHLYVSKVAYGPRIPQTPLSIPFMQHTIPGSIKRSYVEWIRFPYKRLAGFGKIRRDDPVVFNFPAGDTVVTEPELQAVSFYHLIRDGAYRLKELDTYARKELKTEEEYYALSRQNILKKHEIYVRPVDKKDNYIKRCVAIAGDSLQVIDGMVYVNGKQQKEIDGLQYVYMLQTTGRRLNPKKMEAMGINREDYADHNYGQNWTLSLPLTKEMAAELKTNVFVSQINPRISQRGYHDFQIFPQDERYPWNLDQFGPIYIPKKGATVELNIDILPLYERIIDQYEGNELEVKDSTVFINGEVATSYTFKMDYYWMMGDNRHKSLDSRYWGYVPEDHIIGKPKFVWLSLNQDKSFPANIRLKRMFMGIR
jgi:signal peptidase I